MGELVVGVDGSAGSRGALAWAVDAARVRGDHLAVVTVTSPPAVLWPSEGGPGDEELERVVAGRANAMLDEMLAPYGDADVTMTTARLEGVPYEALIDRADRTNGLIVGARGHSLYRRLLLGSVSQQVVVHARAPVTVVPPPEEEGRRQDAVIVGVDGSQGARRALLRAAEEARLRRWELEVVGVQPPPPVGGGRWPAGGLVMGVL